MQGVVDGTAPVESLQSGFSMLRSLPSALRVGSKAKDLLIAVLTNATLCELYVDNGVLTEREATQLEQKLSRNREQRSVQMEYRSLGADAPLQEAVAALFQEAGGEIRE